jgi:hypothetical protein
MCAILFLFIKRTFLIYFSVESKKNLFTIIKYHSLHDNEILLYVLILNRSIFSSQVIVYMTYSHIYFAS